MDFHFLKGKHFVWFGQRVGLQALYGSDRGEGGRASSGDPPWHRLIICCLVCDWQVFSGSLQRPIKFCDRLLDFRSGLIQASFVLQKQEPKATNGPHNALDQHYPAHPDTLSSVNITKPFDQPNNQPATPFISRLRCGCCSCWWAALPMTQETKPQILTNSPHWVVVGACRKRGAAVAPQDLLARQRNERGLYLRPSGPTPHHPLSDEQVQGRVTVGAKRRPPKCEFQGSDRGSPAPTQKPRPKKTFLRHRWRWTTTAWLSTPCKHAPVEL